MNEERLNYGRMRYGRMYILVLYSVDVACLEVAEAAANAELPMH